MNVDYYCDEQEREDRYVFPITCTGCGAEYDNRDGLDCPGCGGSSVSYDGRAAARWNEVLDHHA